MADNFLEQTIRELINYEGQITFERFMRLALYHPVLGYYRKCSYPVGKDGDYVTAPELSPVFGKCIARCIERYWTTMQQPSTFDIMEFGSGKGTLAVDIMRYLGDNVPKLYNAARYYLIEQHMGARSLFQPGKYLNGDKFQQLTLDGLIADTITGCIISNEFFDAFSVHRITMEKNRLRETYVSCDAQGRFTESLGRPIYPVEPFWQEHGTQLQEGQQAEASLRAGDAFMRMAAALHEGYIITIDYGDDAEKLYGPERPEGTVMTYKNHQTNVDYYADIGLKDITAHVNFTVLKKLGHAQSLQPVAYMPQQKFLMEHGALDFSPKDEDLASQNDRLAWRQLMGTGGGFGDGFKVLVQRKSRSL